MIILKDTCFYFETWPWLDIKNIFGSDYTITNDRYSTLGESYIRIHSKGRRYTSNLQTIQSYFLWKMKRESPDAQFLNFEILSLRLNEISFFCFNIFLQHCFVGMYVMYVQFLLLKTEKNRVMWCIAFWKGP